MELLTKASRSGEMTRREQENLQVAYQAACESMVLLRNDGALPFPTKKIALYGPGASRTVKGGTGSGEVNERRSVTILEGLEDRGFEITTRRWLEEYEPVFLQAQEEYREEKRRQVNLLRPSSVMDMFSDDFRFPAGRPLTEEDVSDSGTDCCVYVVSRQSGEGGDRRAERGDWFLTGGEASAIRFCAAHYEKFLLVINSGSALDLGFLQDIPGINAILYLSQPGCEGGHAFADVISGLVSPSGKLADTDRKSVV